MEDAVRLNVNPPTLQRPARPEPKFQGAAIVTEALAVTHFAKSPERLTTVGFAPAPLSHPVTLVAVLTALKLSSAPPLIEMEPLIGADSSDAPPPGSAPARKSVRLPVL